MNADELHKKKLEENALAHGLATLAQKAKSGRLINPKILAAILAVVLIGGLWWYFKSESKKTDSLRWSEYERASSIDDYKKVAEANAKSPVASIAKLAAARLRLTNDGLAKFNIPASRAGAIEAIDAARKELKDLAVEFEKAGDRVLRAESLRLAAQAELALVGVPKPGTDGLSVANQLGSVTAAIELLNTAAKVIGEATPAGERLKNQAKELAVANDRKDNSDLTTPAKLASDIHAMIKPPVETKIEPKPPDKPLDPIPAPKPPEGTGTKSTATTPSTRR
jgi:hypothetical protein